MKIICIGRNYADHAKELNNPVPAEPLIFMKPETAILPKRNPLYYPQFTKDLHYEVELVVRISKLGKHIEKRFAHTYYNEIGIGIDFTARDIQMACKEKGHPWEKAKGFDGSAPISNVFLPKDKITGNTTFGLKQNGEWVQKGQPKDMLFDIDDIIAYTSKFYTLKIGDLIFTGTPAGVGPCNIGDRLEAYIEDEMLLKVDIP